MESFNPRFHLDSERDHHLGGDKMPAISGVVQTRRAQIEYVAPLLQKRDKADAKLDRIYDGTGHRVLRAIMAMYYETKIEAINRKIRAASEAAQSYRQ